MKQAAASGMGILCPYEEVLKNTVGEEEKEQARASALRLLAASRVCRRAGRTVTPIRPRCAPTATWSKQQGGIKGKGRKHGPRSESRARTCSGNNSEAGRIQASRVRFTPEGSNPSELAGSAQRTTRWPRSRPSLHHLAWKCENRHRCSTRKDRSDTTSKSGVSAVGLGKHGGAAATRCSPPSAAPAGARRADLPCSRENGVPGVGPCWSCWPLHSCGTCGGGGADAPGAGNWLGGLSDGLPGQAALDADDCQNGNASTFINYHHRNTQNTDLDRWRCALCTRLW
jgi:hypothetical protein